MLKLQQKVGVLKNGAPFIYATDRTDVRDVFEKKAREEGPRPMNWGEISQLKGLVIPLILPMGSKGWMI